MRRAGVQPVLLPGSVYALGKTRYPRAREMIEAGLAVVLATDFNPGSSPTPSMPMVLSLAATQMKMTPAEGVTAATINAAYSLGRGDKIGSLEAGKRRISRSSIAKIIASSPTGSVCRRRIRFTCAVSACSRYTKRVVPSPKHSGRGTSHTQSTGRVLTRIPDLSRLPARALLRLSRSPTMTEGAASPGFEHRCAP